MAYVTILAGFASFFYADSHRRFDFWLIGNPFRDHFYIKNLLGIKTKLFSLAAVLVVVVVVVVVVLSSSSSGGGAMAENAL